MLRWAGVAFFLVGAIAFAQTPDLNSVAERYARLVLALGQHDADEVDAFYGPPEWKQAAATEKLSLNDVGRAAAELQAQFGSGDAKECLADPAGDELTRLRREYLAKQLTALSARVRLLNGEHFSFDQESAALYDSVAPQLPEEHFAKILAQLEARIPGQGPLAQRYENWRKSFVIPRERLDAVFQLAIKECRARTLAHIELPREESFTVEYVTNKPWGGYNWYQGDYRSVIQVNTDLPIYIDRAVDLAAHEGYPGHHVYNVLLEKNLVRDRQWREFTVYPLFSPQSMIAEGTANFGRAVAFDPAERLKFEREVLFPAAGLDPAKAADYYAVQEAMQALTYAGNEAARGLIDGKMDPVAAARWLEKYAMMDPARAGQRVKFIQRYRSYVINYNYGEDLVRHYLERRGAGDSSPERKWRDFAELISSPRLPSALK